ncbi:MAG: threonine synthase [Promethearchaeota archaeon]
MMILYSTNKRSPNVSFKEAVLKGQAPDKGLYMFDKIPLISQDEIFEFKSLNLKEIAFEILYKFLKEEFQEKILRDIIDKALNFPIPINHISDNNYVCYLDKGPTCSFKDVGARMLASIMEHFLIEEDIKIIILTATSGDTGGAVAQAFHDKKNVDVVVLYPKDEISTLQRKQMTTLGNNITAIGINGKFDDCQRFAKSAFADSDLSQLNLSSANSINIGRLLPQAIYYFKSYSDIIEHINEKVIFSVPSGNFGNLTGGLIAKRMGLPVKRFISAVNENDEFPTFLAKGYYKKVNPSRVCISNAMNVGHPSNLARLIDLYNGHIDEEGNLTINPNINKIRKEIISYSITDEITKETIINFNNNFDILIDPHGAVGWAALLRYQNEFPTEKNIKSINFETADPAKFPDQIIKLTHKHPKIPNSLKIIQQKKENLTSLEIDKYREFKTYLQKNF